MWITPKNIIIIKKNVLLLCKRFFLSFKQKCYIVIFFRYNILLYFFFLVEGNSEGHYKNEFMCSLLLDIPYWDSSRICPYFVSRTFFFPSQLSSWACYYEV